MKKKTKIGRRFLASILTFAMAFSLMPDMSYVSVKAEENAVEWTYSVSGSTITATSNKGQEATLELVADNTNYTTKAVEATIQKSENWEAVDGDDVITYSSGEAPINVGTYTASVEIKPQGKDPITITKQYTISKATAIITVSMQDYNDTDQIFPKPVATAHLIDGTDVTDYVVMNYVYQSNGDGSYNSATIPSSKGSYIVKANFSATSNLTSKNSAQAEFVVHGSTYASILFSGWSYDDTPSEPSVTIKDINGKDITLSEEYAINNNIHFEYYKLQQGQEPEKLNAKPSLPGKYRLTVVVDTNGDYLASSQSFDFEIAKDVVTVNAQINDWTYGDTASTPVVSVSNKKGVDISSDYTSYGYFYTGTTAKGVSYSSQQAPTEAGNYTLKVTAGETTTHKEGVATVNFKIIKKAQETAISLANWTYEDTAPSPSITGLPAGCIYDVTYTYYINSTYKDAYKTTPENSAAASVGAIPKNAGTYYLKAVVDADNYTDANGNSTFTLYKEFTISKK